MDDKLRQLLSTEEKTVLETTKERGLSEKVKKTLKEKRMTDSYLKKALDNEKELNNLIAKEIINVYIHNKERLLFAKTQPIHKATSIQNISSNVTSIRSLDKLFVKAYEIAKKRVNEFEKSILFWKKNKDGNCYVELVYLNKKFFKERGFKITTTPNCTYIEADDVKVIEPFVSKVLNNGYDEIKLNEDYKKSVRERLKEIEESRTCIKDFKKTAKTNAIIITLEICKKVIELYSNLEVGEATKEKMFTVDLICDNYRKKELFVNETWYNLLKYYYDIETVGVFCENNGYLKTLMRYLNKALREIGVKCKYISTGTFEVNIPQFERAVLKASEEEREIVKKV